MNTKRIKIEELKEGITLVSLAKANKDTLYKYCGLVANEKKKGEMSHKLIEVDGDGIKLLSDATLTRWYKVVQEEITVEPQVVKEVKPEEVKPEEVKPEEVKPEPMVVDTPEEKKIVKDATYYRNALLEELANLDICGVTITETGSYTKVKAGKYNCAEIYKGKKAFRVVVLSKALDEHDLKKCKVVPPSYGWTLDAVISVCDFASFVFAKDCIIASAEYRAKKVNSKK